MYDWFSNSLLFLFLVDVDVEIREMRSFMLNFWWKVMENSDLGAKMKSAPSRFIFDDIGFINPWVDIINQRVGKCTKCIECIGCKFPLGNVTTLTFWQHEWFHAENRYLRSFVRKGYVGIGGKIYNVVKLSFWA